MKNEITLAEYQALAKAGRVGAQRNSENGKMHILRVINKIEMVELEYKFHPLRKWKFDYALPAWKIAIEYEGLFSEKSGHTTVKGYTGNCDKYNEAVKLGWRLLRYTALNYKNIEVDLKQLLK